MKHSFGFTLVLLSSLSNKTILHNEKLFKIIGSVILILIIAVVVLYFVSTPLPEGQQGAKASTYRQNSSSHQSDSLGSLRAVSLALEEITIISGTKNAT
jgi:hypothetical protein